MGPESGQVTRPVGAYGLRLENVARARSLLVPARANWPRLRVRRRVGTAERGHDWMTESAALLKLRNGGEIAVDRRRGEALFVLPHPMRAAELVHPLLAPVGAVMAYWFGRDSFHAGAFVADGKAWGVIGERGSGKSTTLGRLALNGAGVLCDDLLVVERFTAFAGPRSVDLRGDASQRLGAGEALGVVGARARWRLPIAAVAPELPFGGWVFLDWGERVEAARLSGADRLMRIHRHRAVQLPPRDPTALLELASLPAWELRRPKRWRSLPDAVDCLLQAVG